MLGVQATPSPRAAQCRFHETAEVSAGPGGGPETPASIDKHEPAGRDERLFRLLLAVGNAAVTDGFDAIAGTGVTTLSLGRGNA